MGTGLWVRAGGVAGAHLQEEGAPGVGTSWGGARAMIGKEQDRAGGDIAEEELCEERGGPEEV